MIKSPGMIYIKQIRYNLAGLRRLSHTNAPLPLQYSTKMDYEKMFSDVTRRREPSVLRELTSLSVRAPQGTISLASGMPNGSTFPFQNISVTLKDGTHFDIEGKELDSALQYQPSTGYAPLILLLQDLQNKEHGPIDWAQSSILISSGSFDGISRAVEMLMNFGDPIIMQHPMYSGVENMLKPYKPCYILADQDEDGVDPTKLRTALEERSRRGETMPKVMYLNPTGANPTGTLLSTERKKELYKLAQDYNIIILEDDAYYYLHFLHAKPVSMLSMDTDGRVLRFDSFSKILSSGLRLGIVTGPKDLVRKIELHIQSSTLQTSSMPQVLAHKLLKSWGHDKLQNHFRFIRSFYKGRRDVMVEAAEKHLDGLAEWTIPKGGMFLWLKIKDVQDTRSMVMNRGIQNHILLVPGSCFTADPQKPSPYVRAAFSIASDEEINKGLSRLASLIKDEQKLSCQSSKNGM